MKQSYLEDDFAYILGKNGISKFVRQHKEIQPAYMHRLRKSYWHYDFAFPDRKIIVEIHGGIWSNGRHTRSTGFIKDRKKMNHMVLKGWKILEITADDLQNQEYLDEIIRFLG